jgi:hypothetical protein
MAPWLNWIEQPPPKGQVIGSNPAGVAKPASKYSILQSLLQFDLQDHAGLCGSYTRTCKEHPYKIRTVGIVEQCVQATP